MDKDRAIELASDALTKYEAAYRELQSVARTYEGRCQCGICKMLRGELSPPLALQKPDSESTIS